MEVKMGFITRTYGSSMSEVKDKFDIKELIEFERFCRDNALWDEMKQCYCKDSYVKISWFEGSGYDFVEASSRMADYAPHRIYNSLIWLMVTGLLQLCSQQFRSVNRSMA